MCVCVYALTFANAPQIAINQKRVWDDYENAHNSAVRAGGKKAGPEVIEMMQVMLINIDRYR